MAFATSPEVTQQGDDRIDSDNTHDQTRHHVWEKAVRSGVSPTQDTATAVPSDR